MDPGTGLTEGVCQEVLKRLVSTDGGEGSRVGSAVLAGVRQGGGRRQQRWGGGPFSDREQATCCRGAERADLTLEQRGGVTVLGALRGSLGILRRVINIWEGAARAILGPGQALWKIRAGRRGLDKNETVIGGWEGS